ncbi:MAG: small multi-drug export protein [Treponema sp.]|jgi:uncharacterized membrane protein|nr:small multi-drug export protein [Treponema sp.]
MTDTARILLRTAALAFLPVSELRGAIPFACANGLPWYAALPFAAAVNALAAPACWLFLSTLHKMLYGKGGRGGLRCYRGLFDRFVSRARRKLESRIDRWGWFGLALFVAVPLPVTGAWTGTLGAWVLGMRRGRALLAVLLGVLLAGIIVTAVTVLGLEALRIFVKRA